MPNKSTEKVSEREGHSESSCFTKGFHMKTSEVLKYRFKLLKKKPPQKPHELALGLHIKQGHREQKWQRESFK